ncbi:hypothetical protein SLS58_004578 [Diplodia intermedia]|uniref:NADP-dependent oxidoreductase domain-containing protein n=1 Tax=Diplodia intermedia TaxID=856260 RepID=A0ABR3TT22_9PEZI
MSAVKPAMKAVFGAMTIGKPGTSPTTEAVQRLPPRGRGRAGAVRACAANGVALYVFNPLAGGFLTSSRYRRGQREFADGERFDPGRWQGRLFHGRCWNDPMWQALEGLRPVAKKRGLAEVQCALRWLAHHSALSEELGDAVVVGASGPQHVENNLAALGQGPLPDDVVEALDAGWAKTRALPLKFWH